MAATGTPTPNLGLRRAQGTDPASVDDINYNSELLDTKLGAVGATSVQGQIDALSASTAQTFGNVQDGLAIVSNGNTHVAIPAGYWVYVKGHGTLSEGLYKNNSGATIAANATLSTSNLTADPDGGLNSVYNALNSKITVLENKTRYGQGLSGEITTSLEYLTGQLELPAGIYIIFANLGLQSYKAVKEIRIYSSTDDFTTSNLEMFSYGSFTIFFTKITETTKFKVQASSVESGSSIVGDSRISRISAIKVS